ncbi:MAG: hypothetical protein SNJ77_01095 [Cytophagales bacterium]
MKNTFLTFVFLTSVLTTIAQNSYKSYDGREFHVGDTILIGIGSGINGNLESIYLDPNNKTLKYPNTFATIKKIFPNNENAIFRIKIKNNPIP